MKKLVCVILTLTMIFSLSVPAFARCTVENKTPVIYISGDGNALWYDNETKSFDINDMLKIYGNSEDGSISEAAFNILYPLIMKGIISDDWDDYYQALYNEISDVYAPIQLDKNGNPATDCGISTAQKQSNERAKYEDRKSWSGGYGERTYEFFYDWRLDPMENADGLNEYIEGVKNATGSDKVSVIVKCLGTNVLLSYIDKYSTGSLKGIGIDVATSMGADFISGMVSGKFGLDGNGLSRLALDTALRNNDLAKIADFAASTVDLLDNTGVLDKISDFGREKIYTKIEYGVVSALALSTFMTYPCYWALVTLEDFDSALNYVFGPEDGEKRQEWAGLIEKITTYNETIKKNVFSILKDVEADGVNIGIVSKYGKQMVPTNIDSSLLGDEFVSAYRSSFGATTTNVYKTFSDEYIAQQTEKGLAKYISPDKHVDASTCLFPEYTWFVKGPAHDDYTTYETDLLMVVMDADRQLTIDDFDWTQFIVYDKATDSAYPMTEDNCNTEIWDADEKVDHPVTKQERLASFLKTLFRWLKSFFELISNNLSQPKDAA